MKSISQEILCSATVLLACACLGIAQDQVEQAIPRVRNAMRQDLLNVQNVQNVRDVRPLSHAAHAAFSGPVTAAQIQRAIDDAILYLRSRQAVDGSLEDGYRPGGGTALAALAMLAAGADPETDVSLQKALAWSLLQNPDETYVRAVRANVWEYALRKCPYDERFRKALQSDYEWLIKALGNKEGWRYQMGSPDWDNSVTQYGVLGIWAARRAGFDPGDGFWKKMSEHFRSCQNADGGWGYQRSGSTANMATAGLATMFLVFDMYHGKDCYRTDNPNPFGKGEAAECIKSMAHGMEWLGKNGGSNSDGYYLYGIERAGVASGRKYFGGRDWFADGAAVALRAQQENGMFAVQGHGGDICHTAFPALFLVYGGAPVAFNKLEYGADQDWNLNPRDLANLTKDLWSAYEKPLNWHAVSLAAPVEEFEAPILFVSGSKTVKFTEEQVAKLHAYIARGGTILAEPSDGSAAFRESMTELAAALFPKKDYPGSELKPIPADHPLYTAIKQDWAKQPVLQGVSDGSRLVFLLSDSYLSSEWQLNRTSSDAFKFALNLLFYATDMGELRGRFSTHIPETAAAQPRQANVVVGRVRHADETAPMDWDAAGACWNVMTQYVRHVSGAQVTVRESALVEGADLTGVNLMHLTGRQAIKLTAGEKEALKHYVQKGGTLLVDAYAGSSAFADSARRELESLFGSLSRLNDTHLLASGRFTGGADLSHGIGFTLPARRALRAKDEACNRQRLEIAMIKDRPAVLFSAYDLSAAAGDVPNFGASGYKPDSARRIIGNIVAYLGMD
jgi:hypothetical protein